MKLETSGGWQEALVSVRDLDRWVEELGYVMGWTVVWQGESDPTLLDAWELPRGTSASEAVVMSPADPTRWVRLISFAGCEQRQIRSSGQGWETGGIFSLLAYCADTQAAFDRAQHAGWSAYRDPVRMEFGGRVLANVVLRAPDGCNFGLYQPLEPAPSEPFPFDKAGAPFNGQQMVRDCRAAADFYREALGWSSWFEGETRLTCNNFGIPDNLVGVDPKDVAIMCAADDAYGQVELVQWNGLEGRDFSELAVPPNLGHLALRWPVDDLARFLAGLRKSAVAPISGPIDCTLEPFGQISLCGVKTPDGVIVELIQPA